jgi:hypothetical protein
VRIQSISLVIAISSAALISACATAGDEPPQNNADGSIMPPGGDAGPLCGNGAINPGEACDSVNLNGATCESQGYQGGVLGCASDCRLDTRNCYGCGDGQRNGDEQCDGVELGGATCLSQGYLGGTLLCRSDTCTYDTSLCDGTEVLKNDNGTCDLSVGCSNAEGTSGNPQSLVECFNGANLGPPFRLTQASYRVSAAVPAPASLNLEVYSWTGVGLPGTRIASVPLAAADRTTGAHTLTLASPVEIATQYFCVGLGAADPNDGFRISYSSTSTVAGASWVDYSTCGTTGFTLTADRATIGAGNFCISATIDKAP